MSDISLTASMRTNLLSLQNTQSLMDQTQERLSTGKKVNSAIDNPSSYYTAQSLTNRASDLDSLLDSMGQGIQTIQAANEGIEAITSFVQQAKAVANTARDTPATASLEGEADYTVGEGGDVTIKIGDKTFKTTIDKTDQADLDDLIEKLNDGTKSITADDGKTKLGDALSGANLTFAKDAGDKKLVLKVADPAIETAKVAVSVSSDVTGVGMSGTMDPDARKTSISQFNDILTQIDQLANDSSYKGVNLLKDDKLKVVFNEDRSSYLEIEGRDASSTGLKLASVSAADWETNEGVEATITSVENAINELRDMATEFGNNYSIVQTRQDFTENLINVLEEGADDLTLADMNEESANMLALQTRQQLGINSLSLASQAAQSVLQLF